MLPTQERLLLASLGKQADVIRSDPSPVPETTRASQPPL